MRTRLLVDSEVALWALAAPSRLTREARALIDGSDAYVSAASILELGAECAPGARAQELVAALEPSGFQALGVSAEHAALAAQLPRTLTDPLDRLLVAQASAERMTLLTSDAGLAAAAAAPARPAAHARRRRGEAPGLARCPIVLVARRR